MPVLMQTGEIGNGARQQYASNFGAQLGSSAGFVAWFLAEILPKEAEGGGAYGSKLAIILEVVWCRLAGVIFLLEKKSH